MTLSRYHVPANKANVTYKETMAAICTEAKNVEKGQDSRWRSQ